MDEKGRKVGNAQLIGEAVEAGEVGTHFLSRLISSWNFGDVLVHSLH